MYMYTNTLIDKNVIYIKPLERFNHKREYKFFPRPGNFNPLKMWKIVLMKNTSTLL